MLYNCKIPVLFLTKITPIIIILSCLKTAMSLSRTCVLSSCHCFHYYAARLVRISSLLTARSAIILIVILSLQRRSLLHLQGPHSVLQKGQMFVGRVPFRLRATLEWFRHIPPNIRKCTDNMSDSTASSGEKLSGGCTPMYILKAAATRQCFTIVRFPSYCSLRSHLLISCLA